MAGLLNIAARLTETITVKRPTGHSSAGDRTLGDAFTCAARIERDKAEVSDPGGRVSQDSINLFTQVEILVGDLVWLPEADTSDVNAAENVVSAKPQRALDGRIVHYEVTLG